MKTRLVSSLVLATLGWLSFAIASPSSCDDKIPDPCNKPRFLGQAQGCACFECNPGTPKAQTVCTNSDANKQALFDKVAKATTGVPEP